MIAKSRVIMATALLGIAAVQSVAAAGALVPAQRAVGYSDLDITAAAGARALYGRLKAAARQVCFQLDGKAPVQRERYRACVAQAMSNAVASVNEPMLTEVYLARLGRDASSARVASSR